MYIDQVFKSFSVSVFTFEKRKNIINENNKQHI